MSRKHAYRLALQAAVVVVAGGSLALAAGAGGSTSTARPVPIAELSLHDARGKLVGRVIDIQSRSSVVIATRVGGTLAALSASRTGLDEYGNTIGSPLLYDSTDCTGQPYDAHNPEDLGSPNDLFPVVILNGSTLFSVSGPAREHVYRSARPQDGGLCEQDLEPTVVTSLPLQELVDLDAAYDPPFAVRGR